MASKGAALLARPVRPAVVLACLGQFAPSVALAPGVPIAVALATAEWELAFRCAVPTALLLLLWGMTRRWMDLSRRDIRRNEALVAAAGVFLLGSAALAYPLWDPGIGPVDAAFEAVSAITSTGLTVFGDVDERPLALLFLRAWGQWVGGLAILVFALSLTVRPGLLAKRLGGTEGLGEDFLGGTRARARRVLVVYGLLTVAAILCLWPLTGSWREALLHGLTAVSTAGFSSHPNSVAAWESDAARAVLMVFSMAGAVSLLFWDRLRADGWRHLLAAREAQALVVLTAAGALMVGVTEIAWRAEAFGALDWGLLGHAAFLSASAQSTTGFSTLDPAGLAPASQLVLIVQMMIGADMGSTGGGLKVARMLVLAAIVRRAVLRTALPPHAVAPVRSGGSRVHDQTAEQALILALLYGTTVMVAWGLLLAFGIDPLPALFEVVSATSTVGLSAGVTSDIAAEEVKAVLMVCMLLGRLEFMALLVLVAPHTWKKG